MANALSMDQALIEKLSNILEGNLDKEYFGVKELAQEIGLSKSQLNRKLQSILGKSTSRFIREFRLHRAMKMLQNNEATASEIAYRVGFKTPTYFNTCFHDYYGFPPGEVKFRDINEDKQATSKTFPEEVKGRTKISGLFNRRLVWINTIAILLLSVLGYNLYQNYLKPASIDTTFNTNQDKTIAILPFKSLSDDPEQQYIADGIAGAIQTKLANITDFKVIPFFNLEKYRNTALTTSEIASELKVVHLAKAFVQIHGDSIRVTHNLINAKTGELKISDFDWELKHIFETQRRIASDIVNELDIKIDPESINTLNTIPTKNVDAYNLYLKGLYFWHQKTADDIDKSINYFNEAIQLDKTFALAYAGIADSYFDMPDLNFELSRDSLYTMSEQYAEKALSIDKNLAQAHATLGRIYCYKDWDWNAAENKFKLAIELDPNYASAHLYYAELLHILFRTKEARREINLALELNPNSYKITDASAWMYVDNGNFEKALSEANKALEFDEERTEAKWIKDNCYQYLGKDEKVFKNWEEEIEKTGTFCIGLIKVEGEVETKFREAFKDSGIHGFTKFYVDNLIEQNLANDIPVYIAANLGSIGENEEALRWLGKAYEQRNNERIRHDLIFIKCMYNFNNLRKDPRFLSILDKLNLGDYEN